MFRRISAVLFAVALATGIVTYFAVEGHDVVVLRTHPAGAPIRRTRIWIAEDGGVPWIEAANPERAFYADLLADPNVAIERATGGVEPYRATPLPDAAAHRKIRELLRRKYGWADRWVGMLVDTSRSVAIRLDPLPRAGVSADSSSTR